MDEKIYCDIMNRIRKITAQNGESLDNVTINLTLTNGEKLYLGFRDITWQSDYIEAWDQEHFIFIPSKNILSISV